MKKFILGLMLLSLLTNSLYANTVDDAIESMVANGAAKGIVSVMFLHKEQIIKDHKAKQYIIQTCKEDKESKRYTNLCIKYAIDKFNRRAQKQYKISN